MTKENLRRNAAEMEMQDRLDRANRYFRLKAAEVLGSETAKGLLLELAKRQTIPYEEISTSETGVGLARLSAAGFCDLWQGRFTITDAGIKFVAELPGMKDAGIF